MDPFYGEEKFLDGSKKMDPLSIYGEGTLLDIIRKMGILFTVGEEKLLDSSSEKLDLLSDSSSDDELDDGLRNMTRDELIKYIKQVVESEGFDVDPLPAGINIYGRLIPYEHDECPKSAAKIARFAIDHNNNIEGSTKLKFDRVIKYNEQPGSPCKYYVTCIARDINTGGTHAYQAKVTGTFGYKESSVDIFRRKHHHQFGKEDEIRFLTIFAINYLHGTTGQDLELVKGIVYDQHGDSCIITFKARDLSTCLVEIYQTEVVSRDPIENSTVIFFIKNPDPSTYQDLVPVVTNPSESAVAKIRQVWGNSGKYGAGPFNHVLN